MLNLKMLYFSFGLKQVSFSRDQKSLYEVNQKTIFSLAQGPVKGIIIALTKFDPNIKGVAHPGWYRTISTTAQTTHSSTLYGVILGQWPLEVCLSFAQRPRQRRRKALHSFGQSNASVNMSYCMKSSYLNISGL